MKERYGPFADRLIKAYPSSEGKVSKTARDLARDAAFGWHTWIWARLQSQKGKGKAYLTASISIRIIRADSPRAGYGSPHGQDVPYVFQHLNVAGHAQRPGDFGCDGSLLDEFRQARRSERARRSAVAGLPGRESRDDVVPADGAYGTGSERRRAEGSR